MSYYLDFYGENTILSNGNSLKKEYEIFEKIIDDNNIPEGVSEREYKVSKEKLKSELFGEINIDKTVFDLSEYKIMKSSGYTLHEWNQLSSEEKGKIMALESISNRLETIERFKSIIKRNRKDKGKNGKS